MRLISEREHRTGGGLRWGAEPACQVLASHGLPIAPATYHAALARPPSPRSVPRQPAQAGDRSHRCRELWPLRGAEDARGAALRRHRHRPDQAGRPTRGLGPRGVRPGKPNRATIAAGTTAQPAGLVNRVFRASRPGRPRAADLTCIRTWAGSACPALATDVCARRIAGWAPAATRHQPAAGGAADGDLGPRAPRPAWPGRSTTATRAGSTCPYLPIGHGGTLAAAGPAAPAGSAGDPCDNAPAASTIGQIKAKLITRCGPRRTLAQLELARLEYPHWRNHRRPHGQIGMTPPAGKKPPATLTPGPRSRPVPNETSLYETQGASRRHSGAPGRWPQRGGWPGSGTRGRSSRCGWSASRRSS